MSNGFAVADLAQAWPRPADARAASGDRRRAELDRLWARGQTFLGTDLAIMGGAMTWVSERNLVAAISNAGGFGVIASGSMMPAMLAEEIGTTEAMTPNPPALEIAATKWRSETQVIAPPMIASSAPRKARPRAHSRSSSARRRSGSAPDAAAACGRTSARSAANPPLIPGRRARTPYAMPAARARCIRRRSER